MWVFAIVVTMLLASLGQAVTGIAMMILAFVNPGNLFSIVSAAAKALSDKYMDLENGEAEPWISVIAFPYVVGECASPVVGFLSHGIAWVGMPAFFAWMAYLTFFTGPDAAAKGTPDFWLAVAISVLMTIGGLFLGGSASLHLTEDAAEE